MLIVLPERTEPQSNVNKGKSKGLFDKNFRAFGEYFDFV